MHKSEYPLIVTQAELAEKRKHPNLLILDVGDEKTYSQHHLVDAYHVPYSRIVMACPPVPGEIRPEEELRELFSELGISKDTWVVAYDDMGGAQAARLLWTLDLFDHPHLSLLDGGIQACIGQGYQVTRIKPDSREAVSFDSPFTAKGYADKASVLAQLDQSDTQFWDARSPEEFSGQKQVAKFGGHIPGAINLNWTELWESSNFYRLKNRSLVTEIIDDAGLDPNKKVITYCQTHRRSALTYWIMKALGFTDIQGYAGAWAEWGNDKHTPKEMNP